MADLSDELDLLGRPGSFETCIRRAANWLATASSEAVARLVREDHVPPLADQRMPPGDVGDQVTAVLDRYPSRQGIDWLRELLTELGAPRGEALLALAGRQAPPALPTALLLPLRLETRFVPPPVPGAEWRLRLRVFPDVPHLVQGPGLTEAERDVLRTVLDQAEGRAEQLRRPGDVPGPGKSVAGRRWLAAADPGTWEQLFRDLASHVGAARAHALLARDGDPDGWETADSGGTDTTVEGLPPHLEVWLARSGHEPYRAAFLEVDRTAVRDLVADDGALLADPAAPGGRIPPGTWLSSFEEARRLGLAADVPLGQVATDLDAVYVVGVGADDPAPLLAGHLAAGRLSLVGSGTPTNTVAGAATVPPLAEQDYLAAWSQPVKERWPGTQWPETAARALAGDLTDGPPDTLGPLPVAAGLRVPPLLVPATWPALWGWAAREVWGLGETALSAGGWAGGTPAQLDEPDKPGEPHQAGDWQPGALLPEGPLPVLRVGEQPYGLLPATSLTAWQPDPEDPDGKLEAALATPLAALRSAWARTAREQGTSVGADAAKLTELLGRVPVSRTWSARPAVPLSLAHTLVMAGPGTAPSVQGVNDWWSNQLRQVLDLRTPGLKPVRAFLASGGPRPLRIALVRPRGVAAADLPQELRRAAGLLPGDWLEKDVLGLQQHVYRDRPDDFDSLLLRLARRSTQVALAWLVQQERGEAGSLLEPLGPDEGEWRLERLLRGQQPYDIWSSLVHDQKAFVPPAGDVATACVRAWSDLADWLQQQQEAGIAGLERALGATLDTAAFRIDPFVVALPWKRLSLERTRGLGAFGWVDAPRPRRSPPVTDGGVLLTVSERHAVTAAVLRDPVVSHEGQPWQLDFTSDAIRDADALAHAIRAGDTLHDHLGRQVEDLLAKTATQLAEAGYRPAPASPPPAAGAPVSVPWLVAAARTAFKQRTTDGAGRVCDGLRLLAAAARTRPLGVDPASLPTGDQVPSEAENAFFNTLESALKSAPQLGPDLDAGLGRLAGPLHTYADLLAAQSVHDLTGRQIERAGAALDAAAGDAPPPPLTVHHVPPTGRVVRSIVYAGLPGAAEVALPDEAAAAARLSPAAVAEPSLAAHLAAQWPADRWVWRVGQHQLTLADLGLEPIDVAGLATQALDELLRRHVDAPAAAPVSGPGHAWHARVQRLARTLAGRPPLAERPGEAALAGAHDGTEPAVALLLRRLDTLRTLARLLLDEVDTTLADVADAAQQTTAARTPGVVDLLARLARWRISPPGPPTVAALRSGADVLRRRLRDTAAVSATPATLDLGRQVVALVAGEGELPLLLPAPSGALPPHPPQTDLDGEWLALLAPVRPALARLEAHQCELLLAGPTPWIARTTHPNDPWQARDDSAALQVLYRPADTDESTRLAITVLDSWTEYIPATEQAAAAAIGFDVATARSPQALLLAATPRPGEALDNATTLAIVAEARELAHARMARLNDLAGYRGALPLIDLPMAGYGVRDPYGPLTDDARP